MDRVHYVLPLFLLFLNLAFAGIDDEPLPNWHDPLREFSDQQPPVQYAPLAQPGDVIRIPAEYEPAQAVVIGWEGYTTILTQIAQIVTNKAGVNVWSVSGPKELPGVPAEKYLSIPCQLDTVWMRDYGPFGIVENTGALGIVDAIYRHYAYRRYDDAAPSCIADEKNVDAFAMKIILDGGNLMLDSKSNLFMTKRIYMWNSNVSEKDVNEALMTTFKAKKIHTFEYAGYPNNPADGTGHIDMFVKLLADDVVMISSATTEPFKSNGEKAVEYFKSITAPTGKPYTIIRVPGWSSGRTWYTYTNSLIVNKVVMVPSYGGHAKEDKLAEEAYKSGMPGIQVAFINSDASIGAGGSIHCVTQLIPKTAQE